MAWKRVKADFTPDVNDPSLIWAPSFVQNGSVITDLSNLGNDASYLEYGFSFQDEDINPCVWFDGSSSIGTTSKLDLDGVDPSYTISCWIKCYPSDAVNTYLMSTPPYYFSLYLANTSSVRCRGRDDGGIMDNTWSGADAYDGQWHQLVSVHDRDVGLYLYVDGVEREFTPGGVQTFTVSGVNYTVGARNPGGGLPYPYKGFIGAPAVYNEPKSAAWVKAEFERFRYALRYFQQYDNVPRVTYTAGGKVSGTPFIKSSSGVLEVNDTPLGDESLLQLYAQTTSYLYLSENYNDSAFGAAESASYGEIEFYYKGGANNTMFKIGDNAGDPEIRFLGTSYTSIIDVKVTSGSAYFSSNTIPITDWNKFRFRIEKDLVLGWRATVWMNDELLSANTGSNPTAWISTSPVCETIYFAVGSGNKLGIASNSGFGFTKRQGWEVQS